MIEHALNNHNEHLKITGDTVAANSYLPFARKQVNTLFNLSKQLNVPLSKKFNIDNVSISVRVFENNKFIEIHATKKEKAETCGTYVSGLVRNCQKITTPNSLNATSLSEYFPKGGEDWENLSGYGIDSNSFITELGYPAGKTQHAYIKSSQYTGFMRYAIQNLLGQDKKIGYKYGFYDTDGLIIENIIPKEIISNDGNYFIQDVLDLKLIKISNKGVFIKTVEHCKPFNIQFTSDMPGIIDANTPTHEIEYERFQSLLKDTSFDIPEDINTTSIIQLIDETGMSEFYTDKNPLFNSCGWLIPSNHTYQEFEDIAEGNKRTRIYGIFNTCQDETKSYLYGIKLTQKRTVLSDSFKLSEEYLTNPTYSSKPNVIYEYTATLHKLMEGEMSSPQLNYPWISNDIGLYIPNEDLDMLKKYNGITQTSTVNEFAPMYVYDDGSSYNINYFNLSVVGLFNIDSNIQSSDIEIRGLEQSITNYFGRNFLSNLQLGRIKVNIDPATFDCGPYVPVVKSFNSEMLTDNTSDGVRSISGIIRFRNLKHTNEKVIIPQYNRNAVISCYLGNVSGAHEVDQQDYIYNYSSDSNQANIVTGFFNYNTSNFGTSVFTKTNDEWLSDGFNVSDYISPYILFYYKNMFNHYNNSEISLYSFGKYYNLNKGSDYDINYQYQQEAKSWVSTYIDNYIELNQNFRLELVFDIFSANFMFYVTFNEGTGYIYSILGYPEFDTWPYTNFIGRP